MIAKIKMQKYEPLKQEPEILKFWKDRRIYEKAKEKGRGKKKFYFLDGPPYTSGKVHLGTAWNKSLKDMILRYKRMRGLEVLDRAGYDMHGLPTENAAEKELGIKKKEEIEKFGVAKFVRTCKNLSIKNMKIMNADFQRLGVWMDFENAYQSVKKEFIDGEWWLVKKVHEKKRLYEGLRSMAWDWRHQTALAKHELEYKTIKDKSIFVRMKVKGKEKEYLIIWTTTPWTIAFNLGIMVHPEFDYVKCKVGSEYWIVAKALASAFISSVAGKKFQIVEEFKGKKLEGTEYVHPFYDELKEHYDKIKKEHPKTHTVVLSEEYVDTSSGSGLVHMAPGCGPEDYEVGHRNNIPAWNLVKENGVYSDEMGIFAGRHALKDNQSFTKDLEKKGALVAQTQVEHEYPHGQRSHHPVIFRTTKQWFFKVEDIKKDLIRENNKIKWVPKAGYNAFNSWLENLRDNSISKQRYWGTPIPIWKNIDNPDDYIVIGSVKELEELSGKKVEEPHIPWIDEIIIEKDGKKYKRVPDILDVWVDAGTVSWNSLDFPANKDNFKKYFPPDFILEGKDQVRGWFNLLHIASMLSMGKRSFNAAYMHGFVNDAMGRKMSKSLENYILPEEVIEKYGADTFRYYTLGGTNAGLDLNYNFDGMKVKHRNLTVLWNLHNYLIDLANNSNTNPVDLKIRKDRFSTEENYIFSKLNSTIRKATKLFEDYRLNDVPLLIEDLFLKLSRTYIQLTRDKSTGDDKKVVLYTVYNVLMEVLKMFAPIAPYITEKIYQNLKNQFDLEKESIHHFEWPKYDEKSINKELELEMDSTGEAIQTILALREKIQLGVRWPLQEAVIVTKNEKTVKAVESLKGIIKKQTNIKELDVQQSLPGIKLSIKADYSQLGPDFGKKAPQIIAKLTSESPETILSHLEKEGKYTIKLDKEKVKIVKEHLIVTRKVPVPYIEGTFKNGFVYLNKDVDEELEAEGYVRELMRRVQELRKKAGLQKKDKISLFIKTDEELKDTFNNFYSAIKGKVGASSLKISDLKPSKKHKYESRERVRDKKFELFLDKV
ncbi:MAG: isoleucine--tRNA ligase [Candidatus Woesearchaeota archaeon]|jgi:isoleucyl-tRNA synthetase|nr:isoleucine--tRNA ligase [Candidatus Woesearchaeota archaeon]|tara:strand:- start:51371 stop:54520 length:3150 start_codon:yes stop_codon:yes gene_type:complete